MTGQPPDVLRRIVERSEPHQRYTPEQELARGGQGAILRVWDEDLQRTLAMKVILDRGTSGAPADPGAEPRRLSRFLEEAQVTGRLDHPGIVPVHELGLDGDGRAYFTMKLVKGRNLKAVFEQVHEGREGWTLTRALGVLLKVCEAMGYAHAKGVIHRDLKPANVMVGEFGEVCVMDWGLARVKGHEDEKDVRIRPSGAGDDPAETEAPAEAELVTMDGDVIGTPAYMPPEQAHGDLEAMGPRSDVYAVGAMLYLLLSGQVPYVPQDSSVSNFVVWHLVKNGPPEPLHRLAPEAPPELVAICEKAMARNPRDRYPDMGALAGDLQAFLENRVVRAYRTGALIELRKWVARNSGLAASLSAAVLLGFGGLLAVSLAQAQGRRVAEEKEAAAERERANVLRLSAFQRLEDLKREADDLWPAEPRHLVAYDEWLGQARELAASLEDHRRQLAALEARARPMTEAEREAARREHPRFEELAPLRAQLAALERARAVRAGEAEVEELALEDDTLAADPLAIAARARPLVDPNRALYGEEARGLALARLALDRVEDDDQYVQVGQVLAWALFANGLDDDALAEAAAVRAVAPAAQSDDVDAWVGKLEAWIGGLGEAEELVPIERCRRELESLEAEIDARRNLRFEREEDRWWHAQLKKLVAEIEAFADPDTGLLGGQFAGEHGWGIARRRAWADTVRERTLTGDGAAAAWRAAIASIADERECPAYHGLRIEPQLGLLPLERDPGTGLWEFSHALSGEVPRRGPDGAWQLTDETGLVLVLLPGGTFHMGAQSRDPGAPNYDAQAIADDGPVHEVTLSPFFLSKYEMNQAQWLRFTGENPSYYQAPWAVELSLLHPVEFVDWFECAEVCRRLGLHLPTEAQWEFGARGGTSTVWWTGDELDSLLTPLAGNFPDLSSLRVGGTFAETRDWPELDDGFPIHAPVHAFAANPFGLLGICGNVFEWCWDEFDVDYYARSPALDPFCRPTGSTDRVSRGGSFGYTAFFARPAFRGNIAPDDADNALGLRPARALETSGDPGTEAGTDEE